MTKKHHGVVPFPQIGTNSIAIAINELDFYYSNQVQTLFDISIDIQKDRITTLIGPSGSGKSTLLRVLNRIYEIHHGQTAHGSIMVDGKNILKMKDMAKLRKKIGMVFQKATPFPMSIFQNVAFALKHHEKLNRSELDDRVESALKQAALWDEVKHKLNHSATALSGGQQQRLCLARTLAMRPSILLLDEPTSALDPASTRKIEEVMVTMKNRYTLILVTHNLRQAQRISDFVAFMRDGKLVEYNNVDKFFNAPKNQATADYICYA